MGESTIKIARLVAYTGLKENGRVQSNGLPLAHSERGKNQPLPEAFGLAFQYRHADPEFGCVVEAHAGGRLIFQVACFGGDGYVFRETHQHQDVTVGWGDVQSFVRDRMREFQWA